MASRTSCEIGEALIDDGGEYVDRHGDPDRDDCVSAGLKAGWLNLTIDRATQCVVAWVAWRARWGRA